ncbi:unnamed protein product [Diatraea saccharalis]|uniref:Major facilitator superfamily (MFS) profile domain-containing protein n=1 Tax=Diatraea saccharalis TaxID=40085 RepID=A0A9N9QZL5_9NEOP|nr:unnamed protein product [Diatraea saccharalis]
MGTNSSLRPRPIIIKFKSLQERDEAWSAKVGLKGTGITVSEFLTKRRHKLFLECRERFGLHSCWTRGGRIMVVGADTKRHTITCRADLDGIAKSHLAQFKNTEAVPSANAPAGTTGSYASPPHSAKQMTSRRQRTAVPPRRNWFLFQIYDWDKKTQSLILSSFFWGYVVMQIPGGVMAKRFGGKPILLIALIVNGCLCALLPILAAAGGWMLVCAARVLMGLTQACLFPATHTLLGQWFPPSERTSISGFVYGGVQVGTIIAMPLSGVLAETYVGWTLIFYTMAGILFFNMGLWYWFSASSPGEHKMISKEERQYIMSSLNSSGSEKSMRTPWKKILTSVPLFAILISHMACNTSFALFFLDMPTYLERGLQISLKNVTMFGIAAGLVGLSFVNPENKSSAILAIVITLTMSGFTTAGFMVNVLDLAPNFAGVLFSITTFAANICSVVMPIMTSYILRNDPVSTALHKY